MNLTFNEEVFKNCRNKEQYFQYIEELVSLGREVQDNGIMAFENEKWQNVTSYEREAIDLLCEGCPPDRLEFMLTMLLNTSDFTEDEYIKAVLFRAFVLFLQPGGISETEMKSCCYRILAYRSTITEYKRYKQ